MMINDFARSKLEDTKNSSFALSLKTWVGIMDSYTNGGHAYHGTMPTDALKEFRNAINEASIFGFDRLKDAQQELGNKVRACLKARQIKSVAAPGFEAPGVIVSYTTDHPGGVSLNRLELKKQLRYFFRAETFCVLQKNVLGKIFR